MINQTTKQENKKTRKQRNCFVALLLCCFVEKRGLAALLTVIIIGAAVLLMAYSASLLGLGELEIGYLSEGGAETFALTDGCLEEALHRLQLNTAYTGGSLVLGDKSCTILVTGSGSSRTITVSGAVKEYNKKIEVGCSLTGNNITIDSWQEKDN